MWRWTPKVKSPRNGLGRLTVTTSAAPAELTAPGAVEKTIDFGFKGPKTLHDGELVRFENEASSSTWTSPSRSRPGRRLEKFAHDLLIGKGKAAEKLIAGPPAPFAGPLSTGGFQQEAITAAPGWYVQVCFMETQDGRDHTLLGMERVIRISK